LFSSEKQIDQNCQTFPKEMTMAAGVSCENPGIAPIQTFLSLRHEILKHAPLL
jgi:hypothetical protein